MSLPEYEPPAKFQPNFWRIFLLIGAWIILSTISLFVASEFYGRDTLYQTFSLVMMVSAVGYAILFVRHGLMMIPIILLSGILQCGGCLHWVGYRSTLSAPVRAQCRNQLHRIGQMLKESHEKQGTFPPAYVSDKYGQPLYSWIVPLLPQIEEKILYEELHLDEPWNSPHNKPLTDESISFFQCPARKTYWYKKNNHIGYIGVVGPETAWSGAVGRSLSEITDDPAQTILLFEVAALDIPWAAPPNLTLDQAIELFTKGDPHGPSTRHDPPNISVLFADGNTGSLPNTISPETLRALLTINGGEKVVIPPPFEEIALP